MMVLSSPHAAPAALAPSYATCEIRGVATAAELERFIRVPFLVHHDDAVWIPPLLVERRQTLSRRRNPFFRHAEVALWIARRDGRDVGRISAQIDRRSPDGVGFFGLLCAIDDRQVVAELLATAEDWLRARGVRTVRGPFSLSINQEAGLLVDGFATPPMLLMSHDRPWLARHLASLGYAKAKDLLAFVVDVEGADRPVLAPAQLRENANVRLRPLRLSAYRDEVFTLAEIFNEAWSRNWGFVPFAPDEIEHMAREMRPLLRERLVWFAEIDGVAAAFAVCLPNLNEAIADLGGRLLPFGWARLLWRLKVRGVTTARLPLLGIRQRYSSSFLGAKLAFSLINAIREECRELGIRSVETSWILEDNTRIIRIIEALGGRRYKTYRLYEKAL